MTPVVSPCTRICKLDARERYCLGCGRTTSEIGQWSSLGDAERKAIMGELPARLDRLRRSSPAP